MIVSLSHYREQIVPALQAELGLRNHLAVPRLEKIVINVGVTEPPDPRARKAVIENVAQQISLIAGQKAQITKANKAISAFKLRQGDPVGVMVTLRGGQMWNFLQRLLIIALPRVKDFRGVSQTAFDGHGNYSLGLEEQLVFPEINYDTIDRIRSLQITLVTSAQTDEAARVLLRHLGMPFTKE